MRKNEWWAWWNRKETAHRTAYMQAAGRATNHMSTQNRYREQMHNNGQNSRTQKQPHSKRQPTRKQETHRPAQEHRTIPPPTRIQRRRGRPGGPGARRPADAQATTDAETLAMEGGGADQEVEGESCCVI